MMQSSSHSRVPRKAVDLANKGKHYDMCVRRSDTYSEEMGQSDLSRRIAHRDSGYPVLMILDPFFVASPSASTKADIGPPAVISNVEYPRRPGRGRTGSVSRGRHGTPHQPFSGEGPALVAGSMSRVRLSVAVGCPTFKIRRQLTIDLISADAACTG